jgi:hypothetical protein
VLIRELNDIALSQTRQDFNTPTDSLAGADMAQAGPPVQYHADGFQLADPTDGFFRCQ